MFQDVSLTQVDEDADRCWQDDGLMVDYELRGGQVDCVLRRCVVADGKVWQLQMTAPLAGNDLPEDRMTPREREMCRDDMNHDFVTGVFNRRYYETEFCTKLDEWTDCHRCAALALVSIDGAEKLSARESDAVMGQLVCFVANQWKKHFDQPAERVVCRLSDTLFAIGCADRTRRELEEELKAIYAEMPKECVASVGLMRGCPSPSPLAWPVPARCAARTGTPSMTCAKAAGRCAGRRRRPGLRRRIRCIRVPLLRETTLKRGIFVWKTRKTTISICWKPSCRTPRWGRTPSISSCRWRRMSSSRQSFCASAISTASSIRRPTPPSTPAAARPRARAPWRSSTPR
ncbi:MAG: hypothetical protein ACLUIR_00250 [Faecalibacterium prausnitzii]